MAIAHVPAWKKLGLKLKYAHDAPAAPGSFLPTIETSPNPKKRKSAAETTPAKKSKRESAAKEEDYASKNAQEVISSPSRDHTPPTSNRKRKSVSFTPSTKFTDGGRSLKDLYREGQIDNGTTIDSESVNETEAEETSLLPVALDTAKKTKKDRKPKRTKLESKQSQASDNNSISRPLQYLDEYYTSRSTWKFNKARQVYLMKHVFELEKIPSSYNAALRAYILGLEGRQARIRLHERSQKVIDEDEASLAKDAEEDIPVPSSPESGEETHKSEEDKASSAKSSKSNIVTSKIHRSLYRAAVRLVKANIKLQRQGPTEGEEEEEEELLQDEEWKTRLSKRERAEMLLWATAQGLTAAEEPKPVSNAIGNGQWNSERQKANFGQNSPSDSLGPKANGVSKPVPTRAAAGARNVSGAGTGVIGSAVAAEKVNGSVPAPTNGTAGSTPYKRKRRQKKRTTVLDEDSSSESSDSSSGEEEQAQQKPLVKSQKGRLLDDDATSSSGDSSSSGS